MGGGHLGLFFDIFCGRSWLLTFTVTMWGLTLAQFCQRWIDAGIHMLQVFFGSSHTAKAMMVPDYALIGEIMWEPWTPRTTV